MRVALAEQIAATTAQREQLTQQMPMHQKAADRGDHHRQPEHAGQQQSPGIRHVQVHMQIDEEVGEPVAAITGVHLFGIACTAILDLQGMRIDRSEEHTSELQSLMRISYAVFCLQKKNTNIKYTN